MFHRILINNFAWSVTLDWLGMGQMRVLNKATGTEVFAPITIKNHMVNVLHELNKVGIPMQPGNRLMEKVIEAYANMAMNPDDLITRTVLNQPPESYALDLARAIIMDKSESGT